MASVSSAPLCACGCGQPVSWSKKRRRFMRYANLQCWYRRDRPESFTRRADALSWARLNGMLRGDDE